MAPSSSSSPTSNTPSSPISPSVSHHHQHEREKAEPQPQPHSHEENHDQEPKPREGNEKEQEQEQDPSLTTILTRPQRQLLAHLITQITSTMRAALASTFDPGATLLSTSASESSASAAQAQSEDDRILNPDFDTGSVDVAQLDREKALRAEREREVGTPAMRALRKAAEGAFEDWAAEVRGRVGEVLGEGVDLKKEVEGEEAKVEDEEKNVGKENEPADTQTVQAVNTLQNLSSPIPTPLSHLPQPKRVLILHSTLLLLLSLKHYTAPSRILLLHLASALRLPPSLLSTSEHKVAHGLLEAAKAVSGGEEEARAQAAAANQAARKWKVGLASVAGAAVIGITGGMAAPLVAAGVGSVMGGLGLGASAAAGYLGSVAGSTVLVGGLFG